jgi:NADH-quinone oxidoreductase subunit G
LTSKEYRFKARPWDLVRQVESTCPACSRGCSILFDVRHLREGGQEVLRIRPRYNPEVNGYWMCDEGRFEAYPRQGRGCFETPLLRRGDGQEAISWEEAISFLAESLSRVLASHGPEAVAGLLSTWLTLEELYVASAFLREVVETPHLDYRVHPVHFQERDQAEDHLLRRTDKSPNTQGARLLGLFPAQGGWGTREILTGAATGRLKTLFLFEVDPWEEPTLQAEVTGAREGLDLLVVWAVRPSTVTSRADLVFPVLGYGEKAGTIVNFAGRVQRLRRAAEPKGKVLSLAEALSQFALTLGRSWRLQTPGEIWQRLNREHPAFAGIRYEEIGPMGVPVTAHPVHSSW